MNKDVAQILQNGGLIVFPSDTVYGLLCDATNEKATDTLFAFKERPKGKPVSIFVSDLQMAKEYVYIDEAIEKRLESILPGPYTIVLPSKHKTIKALESERGTLGIRIPKNERILALVKKYGKPLTATSANLSTQSPHYSIESFKKQTSQKRLLLIDHIEDGGELPHNKPSTVIDFTSDEITVLRQGDGKAPANVLFSKSEKETKEIASNLLKGELKDLQKPLVFILRGDLGAGKTIFAKGLGETLSLDKIISPTFVVYYEYPVTLVKDLNIFVHADLYNVSEKSEFDHLGLLEYLRKGVVLAIEWGDKAGDIIEKLKEKARIILVTIEHVDQEQRKITISDL